MRIAILLFDEVDLMDVAGPYEVFLTAARLQVRHRQQLTFEVLTVALDDVEVTAYGGLGLRPHVTAEEVGAVDVLLVPGAVAIDRVAEDERLIGVIGQLAADADLVSSVCTGAFLLDRAGLLDGVEVTTHWEDAADLADRGGPSSVRDDVRWVDAGDVVTAGGLSSGVAMALHLVERSAGRELAEATARQIDYVWTEARSQ